MAQTLFDKVWESHVIRDLGDGWALLHIDRHLLHDLSGPPALKGVLNRGQALRHPELAFATPDHAVSSAPNRTGETFVGGAHLWSGLRTLTKRTGIRFFDLGELGQGIVHVIGPELGIVLPGTTVVCGDSHTCTNGGMGALAFGIGTSESTHVLATQTLRQQKPKRMRVSFNGELPHGVGPKDLVLHMIATLGGDAGVGYAIEYAGTTIEAMSVEGRLTVCNLSVEIGSKIGMVAPDDKTFSYLQGRQFAPKGQDFETAVRYWKTLKTDSGASFDRDVVFDVSEIAPSITWGTSPEHAIPITGIVPSPTDAENEQQAETWRAALAYMGLEPGTPIRGLPIDQVFIGSCTNSRLSDLQDAAEIVKGKRVAQGVSAWVVPGSEAVKREAEGLGLDQIFREAGFEWRQPGCSMCVAANGETVAAGARCISTSNRNFVGRQGPGARTHLASPAMAAAAAIAGVIIDVRELL